MDDTPSQTYEHWQNADLSEWNEEEHKKRPDRVRIEEGSAVPCRICEVAFRRLRLTLRYCSQCGIGFCEGEHGNFAVGGRGVCVRCGPYPMKRR
jgi:hypothetical protein